MSNKPNLLVVGAAKSGTTSLFHYLNKHPNIYIPEVKECRFFSQLPKNFKGLGAEFFPNSGITDEKEYFELFTGHEDNLCGDISNDYLYYYEESIKNIKKYLDDDVKIIIILRNPIDRAYSNYMHHIRDGWENVSFEEALEQEQKRIQDNWAWSYHYFKTGIYYNQVKAYLDNFSNVKVYLFEEILEKEMFLNDLYTFLGIAKVENSEDNKEYNVSGYPKNKIIHNFLNNDNILKSLIKPLFKLLIPKEKRQGLVSYIKNNNLEKRAMNHETREKLKILFKEDIKNLSKLINRDLSHWLN